MGPAWSDALEGVVERLAEVDLEWMLVGSAATALRGAAVEPGDLDLLARTPAGVHSAAAVLPSGREISATKDPGEWFSSAAEPVLTFGDTVRWTVGRWMMAGTKVELAHIDHPDASDLLIETFGGLIWRERSVLEWRGMLVPLVPLEVQLATMIVREQLERLQTALAAVDSRTIDVARLRRALSDRRELDSTLRVPIMIERLLAGD